MFNNGWILTALLLLPNALYLLLTPSDVPPETDGRRLFKVQVLETIEKLGQIGSFALPLFCAFRFDSAIDVVSFALFCGLMAFYYAGWIRYAAGGRPFRLLFAPMIGVPIPMAVAPVLAIFCASINFHFWPLTVAAVILGVGHIPVSWMEWQRCQSVVK